MPTTTFGLEKTLPASCIPHLISPSHLRRLLCCGRVRLARAIQEGTIPQPVEVAGRLVFRLRDVAPTLEKAGLSHLLPPDLAAAADAVEAPK